MANDIIEAYAQGTKKWTRTRKPEERSPASRSYRYSRMTREKGVSFKEAAAEIMEAAYLQVSGGGKYPANARQIMYAARGHIQKSPAGSLTTTISRRPCCRTTWTKTTLLTGTSPTTRADTSPSRTTGENSFGIGTLEVRDYLAVLRAPNHRR